MSLISSNEWYEREIALKYTCSKLVGLTKKNRFHVNRVHNTGVEVPIIVLTHFKIQCKIIAIVLHWPRFAH